MLHRLSETFDSPHLRILFQSMELWKLIIMARYV